LQSKKAGLKGLKENQNPDPNHQCHWTYVVDCNYCHCRVGDQGPLPMLDVSLAKSLSKLDTIASSTRHMA